MDRFGGFSSYPQKNALGSPSLLTFSYFSDPPLDEDEIPTGEWVCIECRTSLKKVRIGWLLFN